MKSKAALVMVIVLTVAGFTYATTPRKFDDQEVAELKRTLTELQERVTTLESRVNDMSSPKPRLIIEHTHQPNQH